MSALFIWMTPLTTHRLDAALTAVEQRLPADFPVALAHTVFLGVRRHLEQFNRGHLLAE